MTPLRRTALARRTELARTPLRRKKVATRVAAAKRRVERQRRQRDTGPDQATKALLWERAKGRCEICGRDVNGAPFSRHHRRPRGMGGTTVDWINDITNLLLLCGSATSPNGCHRMVESDRARAIEAGWLVPMGYQPAEVPVYIRPEISMHAVYLTTDGRYAEGAA